MIKIFLSYSTQIQKLAQDIKAEWDKYGLNTWLDIETIKELDPIWDKIKKGIDESNFFVVLIDKNAIDSDWVKREVEYALKKEQEIRRLFVIPILIEEIDKKDLTNSFGQLYNNRRFISINENNNKYIAQRVVVAILNWFIEKFDSKNNILPNQVMEIQNVLLKGFFDSKFFQDIRFVLYNSNIDNSSKEVILKTIIKDILKDLKSQEKDLRRSIQDEDFTNELRVDFGVNYNFLLLTLKVINMTKGILKTQLDSDKKIEMIINYIEEITKQ